MFKHTPYPCILLLFLMLSGSLACMHSNVYEKNYTLKGHQWNEADIPSFAFEISDTSAAYSLYFTIRHTDAYPFSNIWLQQQTMAPGEQQAKTVRIEIPLAQTDGKWLKRDG